MAAAVGIGISTGMESYYKEKGLEQSVIDGQHSAVAFLQSKLDSGAIIVPRSEATYRAVPDRVEKAIRGFDKRKPFPSDWHSFLPELTFPDHGRARADLLCQSDLGPCIVDFKSKVTVSQEYILNDFLFDAETSWQLYHYVYSGRQMGLDIRSFAICLIVIEPLKFHLEQWIVDEDYLKRWEMDAWYWWTQMERSERDGFTARVGDHRTKYGLCELYDGCINNAWELAYTKKDRV